MTLLDIWYIIIANLAAGYITAFTIIPFGMVIGWFDYKDYPQIRKKFMYGVFKLWLVVMGISAAAWIYILNNPEIFLK